MNPADSLETVVGSGIMLDGSTLRPLIFSIRGTTGDVSVRYWNVAGTVTVTNVTPTAPVTPTSGDYFTFGYWLPIV